MEMPTLMPALPVLNTALFLSTPVLVGILVLFFIIYSIISSVLMYHWSAYGMGSAGILVAETLFLFVSVVLFVFSGLSLFYY